MTQLHSYSVVWGRVCTAVGPTVAPLNNCTLISQPLRASRGSTSPEKTGIVLLVADPAAGLVNTSCGVIAAAAGAKARAHAAAAMTVAQRRRRPIAGAVEFTMSMTPA